MARLGFGVMLTVFLLCAGCPSEDMAACRRMCEPVKVFKFENGNCYCLQEPVVLPASK